jgi:hypothetical protein
LILQSGGGSKDMSRRRPSAQVRQASISPWAHLFFLTSCAFTATAIALLATFSG